MATPAERTSRASLVWREGSAQDELGQGDPERTYARFLQDVFDMAVPARRLAPHWRRFGYDDADGRCVASAQLADLVVWADGQRHDACGLRLVGVVADWRGQGLFRDLMHHALARGGQRPMLLYAGEPDLYRRFGFHEVAQHAFTGAAPEPVAAPPARLLGPCDADGDAELVERLLATRSPLSDVVSLLDAPGLFRERLAADRDVRLAHLPGADAVVAFEDEGDTLTLIDVVAAAMPSLAAILGALPRSYARVTTLFAPDRLRWQGEPVTEDTGLMVRGVLPLRQPFMLPPTTEF